MKCTAAASSISTSSTYDVVVIGAGLGGLSAAALLANYGMRVCVCEAHSIAGGAAHAWERDGYTFESGPSLYSGIAERPSVNPLGQLLHALDEELPCIEYSTWMCHLPEMGSFLTTIGDNGKQFASVLRKHRGDVAVREWEQLMEVMRPMSAAAGAVPPMAIRGDLGNLLTIGRCLPRFAGVDPRGVGSLLKPFSTVMDGVLRDQFLRDWLDMLCFLLSGRKADGTITAEIGFMFNEWYRPGAALEFPVGGSGAIVDALIRGLEKAGGRIMLSAPVDEILIEQGRACGVRLARGRGELRARKAVISNASIWDTVKLLHRESDASLLRPSADATSQCDSFMHLHLGIDATGLPDDLEIHHIGIDDWGRGVDSPLNLAVCSIPSVLDPSLAPPGKHVVHAYTPATEPYSVWEGLSRSSEEYKAQKRERAEVLYSVIEKAIPDVRERVEVEMIGTPLTHSRFLHRDRGTYGGYGWVGSGSVAPSPTTPIDGLMLVGDSSFPGPGVPAVAASGAIAANSLVSVAQHYNVLSRIL